MSTSEILSRSIVKSHEERPLLKRRDTVVEQAAEGFIEEKERRLQNKKEKQQKTFKEKLCEFLTSIYNPQSRQLLERDGLAWFKLSLCYFIFYAILSGVFIGLLAIFALTLDFNVPRYYDKTSVMNYADVNPGLGFRPQYNPEDAIILLNFSNPKQLYEEHVHTLEVFLEKYEELKNATIQIIKEKPDRIAMFDYNKIIENTPCSREKHFGYLDGKPCVALKLNKIYNWRPQAYQTPPPHLNIETPKGMENLTNYFDKFVFVNCEGEQALDKDNIGNMSYYSLYPSTKIGGLPTKYYPYRKQPNYLSPLVFVQFESVTRNVLVNVKCRAWAKNIDNEDRTNQRGMVRFELYITK